MKTRLLAAVAALGATLCISGVVAQSRTTQQPHRAVRHRPNPNMVPAPHPIPAFGDPLPGLNLGQLAAFAAGLDEFENVETVASGLGPIFNNVFGLQSQLSKMMVAATLCFFPVMINTVRGLLSASPAAIELLRSYAASEREVFLKVRIPAAVPYVFKIGRAHV